MKTGRPKAIIDKKLFDKSMQLPLTKDAIASLLCISADTLQRYCKKEYGVTFAVLKQQKAHNFRKDILAKQFEMAMKGDRVLLIWLGKQYCEQSDAPKVSVENKTFNMSYSKEDIRSEIEKRRAQNEKETKEAKGQEIINGVKIGSDQINS